MPFPFNWTFSQSISNLFQFPSPLPGRISTYGTFSWTFHEALEQTNHCIIKSLAKGKAPICRHAASLWHRLNWFELHFSAQLKLPSTVKLFNSEGVLSSLPPAPVLRLLPGQAVVYTRHLWPGWHQNSTAACTQAFPGPGSSQGRAHPAGFLGRRQRCRKCTALQAQLQEAPSASGKLWGKPQMEKLSGSRILILKSLTLQMSREQQASVIAPEQPLTSSSTKHSVETRTKFQANSRAWTWVKRQTATALGNRMKEETEKQNKETKLTEKKNPKQWGTESKTTNRL